MSHFKHTTTRHILALILLLQLPYVLHTLYSSVYVLQPEWFIANSGAIMGGCIAAGDQNRIKNYMTFIAYVFICVCRMIGKAQVATDLKFILNFLAGIVYSK